MSQSPHEENGDHTGIDELTRNERHRLLALERRRVALDVLTTRTAPVELEDIAEKVATREEEVEEVDVQVVERVAASLHHVHLPKMADIGVIDYNADQTRVESCPDSRAEIGG